MNPGFTFHRDQTLQYSPYLVLFFLCMFGFFFGLNSAHWYDCIIRLFRSFGHRFVCYFIVSGYFCGGDTTKTE